MNVIQNELLSILLTTALLLGGVRFTQPLSTSAAVRARAAREATVILHVGPILPFTAERPMTALPGTSEALTPDLLHANLLGGRCDAVGYAAIAIGGFELQTSCVERHDWIYEKEFGYERLSYSQDLVRSAMPRTSDGDGDPGAQVQLGIAFAEGLKVRRSTRTANQW